MLRNALKTKCGRGHDLTDPENTRLYDGKRQCVVCQRGYQRIRAGWPLELAFTFPKHQAGQRPPGYSKVWEEGEQRPVLRPVKPLMQRFMDNVVLGQGCWEWTGPKNEHGYGRFYFEGRNQKAHRVAYQLLIGPIPTYEGGKDGVMILHSCDNRLCVNPLHLRLGNAADNINDAKARGRLMGNKHRRYLTGTAT